MNHKLYRAMESIQASTALKEKTISLMVQGAEQTKAKHSRSVLLLSMAGSICLFLLVGWTVWFAPVSYVSIDVNPSIELTLNRLDYVLQADGRNEEGEQILHTLSVKGKQYLEAVETVVSSAAMQPYLQQDAELTVTVASPREEKLVYALENSTVCTQYHGYCQSINLGVAKEAKQCNLSMGKYQIYQQIIQYEPDFTIEECRSWSMKELKHYLTQYTDRDDFSCDENVCGQNRCRRQYGRKGNQESCE